MVVSGLNHVLLGQIRVTTAVQLMWTRRNITNLDSMGKAMSACQSDPKLSLRDFVALEARLFRDSLIPFLTPPGLPPIS